MSPIARGSNPGRLVDQSAHHRQRFERSTPTKVTVGTPPFGRSRAPTAPWPRNADTLIAGQKPLLAAKGAASVQRMRPSARTTVWEDGSGGATGIRSPDASAAQGVADCGADPFHSLVVDRSDVGRERRLCDRVESVAVDRPQGRSSPASSWLNATSAPMLRMEVVISATVTRARTSITSGRVSTTTGRRLRPASANQISPRVTSQSTSRPRTRTDRLAPDDGDRHRGQPAIAARTAASTPSRAAADTLMLSRRAVSARSSSKVKLVRVDATIRC